MMRTFLGSLGLLAVLASLGGCGSSPSARFYTLDPVPPAGPAAATAIVPVKLDRIILPPELDRLEVLRRVGPDRVEVAGLDRWAGPLDEMIRRALTTDLAQRLPAGQVLGPTEPAPPSRLGLVSIDIDRFEPDSAGRVVLEVHWTLVEGDHATLRRSDRIESAADAPGTDAAAAAMARALGLLADHIATALSAGS